MKILFINPRKSLKCCFYRKTITLYHFLKNTIKNLDIKLVENSANINLDIYDKILTFTPFLHLNLENINIDYHKTHLKKIILIQTEHMLTNKQWFKVIVLNIHLIHTIIEFSENNINLLKQYTNNIIYERSLFGYSPIKELIYNNLLNINGYEHINKINGNLIITYNNSINKDIDVLIYGHMSQRRLILHDLLLKNNIKSVFIQSFKNINEMNNILSRSKIVPVIYSFDTYRQHNHLDFYRITYQISNKIFTIHEQPFDNEINDDIKKNIIFFNYDNILNIIKTYLDISQNERDIIVNNNYEWFKNNYNINCSKNIEIINKLFSI